MTDPDNLIEAVADDFDNMLHALGRPKSPTADCYRNYFCTAANGPLAQRFEALGWWDFMRTINDGRDAIYSVNGAGKQALTTLLASMKGPDNG